MLCCSCSEKTAQTLAKAVAKEKLHLTNSVSELTKELAREKQQKNDLISTSGSQAADLQELREQVRRYAAQVADMTPTDIHEAAMVRLEEASRDRDQLRESLAKLQEEYNADKVDAAELLENYNLLRTEFKLLLSQPQFKNIRVNSKISKLLNNTGE